MDSLDRNIDIYENRLKKLTHDFEALKNKEALIEKQIADTKAVIQNARAVKKIVRSCTYSFGKVDYMGRGIKSHEVTVEVNLRHQDKQGGTYVFSACANVYNPGHTDIVMGGQCFDSIKENFPEIMSDDGFALIYEMHDKYHLNDMHPGTPAQENALKQAYLSGELKGGDYNDRCGFLSSVGLLEDKNFMVERNGKKIPYKYGSDWLTEKIPEDDLEIISLIASGNLSQAVVKYQKMEKESCRETAPEMEL